MLKSLKSEIMEAMEIKLATINSHVQTHPPQVMQPLLNYQVPAWGIQPQLQMGPQMRTSMPPFTGLVQMPASQMQR